MSNDEKRPLGKIALQRKAAPASSRASEDVDALRVLAEKHGVPGIDLTQIALVLEHLDVVPREVSESHRILPVLVRNDRVFLAMAEPADKRVIDEVEFVTGKKVYPYVAVPDTIVRTIAAAYDAKSAGEMYFLGPNVPEETLKQLGIHATTEKQSAAAPQSPEAEPAPPPAVVDEAMERAADEARLSTSDFGNVGEEISSVSALPDELRVRAGEAAAAMTSGAGKLVLVVDDEADIRKMLKKILVDKGHRVIEADRGLLALRLVKEHMPDLLVLDAMLPELHGFDIARRIKGSAKYGHIPIVMVSAVYRGWRIAEDLKQSYGIEEYIEKPFRLADVVAAITRALAAKGAAALKQTERDPEAISAEAAQALNDGIASYKAGDLESAILQLKRGTQIDPLSYRLHFHLALLFGKKGMVYEGIQELERAVDLNPKHFPALKNLAVLYEKAGFKNKAIEMWERCVHGAPDDATRESIKSHIVKLL
jgi:DNA-binding response OmpR family regulator